MMKREQNSFRVQTDWLVRGTGGRGHRNTAPSPGHPLNRLPKKLRAPRAPSPVWVQPPQPHPGVVPPFPPPDPCTAPGQNPLRPAWAEVSPVTARDSIWISSKEPKSKDFLSLLFKDVICINCMKRNWGGGERTGTFGIKTIISILMQTKRHAKGELFRTYVQQVNIKPYG